MFKFGFNIFTNNPYTNIAIYAIIATIVLLSTTYCIKKYRNKHQKKTPHLESPGTGNHNIISVSEVDIDTDIESDRPSSAIDQKKVAFFDAKLINLIAKTSDGKSKQFSIMNTFTISQAKEMIAKQFEIPVKKQEIRYKKKRCNSIAKIEQLNIKDGDIIEIIELSDEQIRDRIKITLKRNEMDDTVLYCSNLITVRQFKKEVNAKFPVVLIQDQVLYFEGTELTDMDATLQEHNMHEDCVVDFEWKKVFID